MKNSCFLSVVLLFVVIFQSSAAWAFPLKKNDKMLFRSVISGGGSLKRGSIFTLNDVKGQPCLVTSSEGTGMRLSHGYFFSPSYAYPAGDFFSYSVSCEL